MPVRLSIRHTTHYRFEKPVAHGVQQLRLKPRSSPGQAVVDWRMELEGAIVEAEYEDHHRNRTTLASAIPGACEITVTCEGLVTTEDCAGVAGPHAGPLPLWFFCDQTQLTDPGARMHALANSVSSQLHERLDVLHRLSAAVLQAMRYEIGQTNASTTAEHALSAGVGVCQDHAHVFIGCARLLGIPARYASGYLMMNDRIDQEAGHSWAEAHVDGLGWVGFDVSNGICPDERYVRVATGRDYRDAAPITGLSYGAGETVLNVALAVEQHLSEQ
jgi:transglutaminase-like putative cysteine protease